MERIEVKQVLQPTEVDAKWAVVVTMEGTFLQISTYGSDARSSGPKVSQTIQIDRVIGRELRLALDAAFGAPGAL